MNLLDKNPTISVRPVSMRIGGLALVVLLAFHLISLYFSVLNMPSEITPEGRRNAFKLLPSLAQVADQVNTRQGFASLPDGSTFYTLRGPEWGSKIVLIHGISVFGFCWDETGDLLARRNYRVLNFDLFGRGFSDSPRNMKYDDMDFVRQTRDLIDSLFGNSEPVTLVGISLGGGVAARFAELYPERVSRLILFAPTGTQSGIGPMASLLTVPVLGEILFSTFGPSVVEQRMKVPALLRTLDEERLGYLLDRMSGQWEWNPGFVRALPATLRNFPFSSMGTTFDALGQRSNSSILIVWGERDDVVPFEASYAIRRLVPHAEFLAIPDCGHDSIYEKREETHSSLLNFLFKTEERARTCALSTPISNR